MSNELKESLKEQIAITEKNISDLAIEIDKAKRIGLDTKALELELNSQKSQVKLVKDTYGL